jgi:transcriptional regulator with XRE-family HTH domain
VNYSARNIGKNIRRRRIALSLNQTQLAAALGVTQNAVSKWEVGSTTPNVPRLVQLASALGSDPGEMLWGENEPGLRISALPSEENSKKVAN